MRLYLVRHGIAELSSITSGIDEDRELTSEGIEMIQRVSLGLGKAGYIPEVLLSSPLVRARQTAEILREHFGPDVSTDTHWDLAPGGDRESLHRHIIKYTRRVRSLMLVGHHPSLGEVAGDMAFESSEHYFNLKEGEVCVIEVANYQGRIRGSLLALLPPIIWGT